MKEDGRIISQFWFFTKSIIASDIQRKFENSKDERRVQRRWLREVDEKSLKCNAVHVNKAFKENTIIYGNVVDYYGSVHLVEIAKWSSSPLYERKRCTHLFIHALTETAFCSLIFVEFFNVFFFFLIFQLYEKLFPQNYAQSEEKWNTLITSRECLCLLCGDFFLFGFRNSILLTFGTLYVCIASYMLSSHNFLMLLLAFRSCSHLIQLVSFPLRFFCLFFAGLLVYVRICCVL